MEKKTITISNGKKEKEIICITQDTVTLYNKSPFEIGSDINIDIKLPEEILLDSFQLDGTIKTCDLIQNNGSNGYLIEISINNLPSTEKQILKAYIDFFERERQINEIKIDYNALENAFNNFGQQLNQLMAEANLLLKKSQGKTTTH
jgi:hypothetical protein